MTTVPFVRLYKPVFVFYYLGGGIYVYAVRIKKLSAKLHFIYKMSR